MTRPIASDTVYPTSLGAAPLKKLNSAKNASLTWGRIRRAIGRQIFLFAGVALLVLVAGVLYDIYGGVDLQRAALQWAAVGAGVGALFALVREAGRNTIGSLKSLDKHRAYTVLGAAPELTEQTLRELPPDQRTPLGCLAFQPASAFATAFRDLQGKLASVRVVAFIGSAPNEGATTAALCAAISATQQGRRVIIVDCDLRRRSLTRLLAHDAEVGVLEAAEDAERWQDAVHQEAETGLYFIPAAKLRNPWRNLFGAKGLRALLQQLRNTYDLVILDCPPALSNADGAMMARLADKCVLVAAWDETPLSVVRNAMRSLMRASPDETGLYVNRVPAGYRFGRLRGD